LAERIKALKAANTIEATPQRARQKRSSAEEPITARIRRRHTEASQTDRSDGQPGEPERDSVADQHDSASKQRLTFQERIAQERESKGAGPNLR
jgi:hypothetical protein